MSPALPELDDFLSRFMKHGVAHEGWGHYHVLDNRVSLRRFQTWMQLEGLAYSEITWKELQGLHRFLAAQGVSTGRCLRAIHHAQRAIRWGVEQGELPQKLNKLYAFKFRTNSWDPDLPLSAEAFLSQLDATLADQSVKLHRYSLRVFHTFLREKRLTYRKLKIEHGADYIKYLHGKKFYQRGKGQLATRARIYLKWLYERQEISRHPDEILPSRIIPKPPHHLPKPLDPELDLRLQALLRETDDLLYKSILLLRYTGMRVGELRILPFHCMEGAKPGPISLRVPPFKLGIERLVPLDEVAVSLVEDIQRRSLKNTAGEVPDRLVALPRGTPFDYGIIRGTMTEICARLDVDRWINMHALRHTYATSLLNAGLSLGSLKELLGHKTIIMTLGYAKVAQAKIHVEYREALAHMNREYIPNLLKPENERDAAAATEEAFKHILGVVRRKLDLLQGAKSADQRKRLLALANRLSKLKSETLHLAQCKDQI